MVGYWQEEKRSSVLCLQTSAPEPTIACLTAAGEFADPDLQSRFPFRLITPPHPDLLNSTFGEFYPDKYGTVLVHPEDAVSL